MSNLKDFTIRGRVPYDLGRVDDPVGYDLVTVLGIIKLPGSEIDISFTQTDSMRNHHGGFTSMYNFEFWGDGSATPIPFLQRFMLDVCLCEGGYVTFAEYTDIDNDQGPLKMDLPVFTTVAEYGPEKRTWSAWLSPRGPLHIYRHGEPGETQHMREMVVISDQVKVCTKNLSGFVPELQSFIRLLNSYYNGNPILPASLIPRPEVLNIIGNFKLPPEPKVAAYCPKPLFCRP